MQTVGVAESPARNDTDREDFPTRVDTGRKALGEMVSSLLTLGVWKLLGIITVTWHVCQGSTKDADYIHSVGNALCRSHGSHFLDYVVEENQWLANRVECDPTTYETASTLKSPISHSLWIEPSFL